MFLPCPCILARSLLLVCSSYCNNQENDSKFKKKKAYVEIMIKFFFLGLPMMAEGGEGVLTVILISDRRCIFGDAEKPKSHVDYVYIEFKLDMSHMTLLGSRTP